ncbi:hypothetical protein [Aphanizomenon phage Yong-DA]|nr:hypothetical protein [Aphanizomenon phage Yong-DA]
MSVSINLKKQEAGIEGQPECPMFYLFLVRSCNFLLMRREKKEIVPDLQKSSVCSSPVQVELFKVGSMPS